jgi:hypothetical protein
LFTRANRRLPLLATAVLVIAAALAPFVVRSWRAQQQPNLLRRVASVSVAASSNEQEGIAHAAQLLPLARRLAFESLRELAASRGIDESALARAGRRIDAVETVRLDETLGDFAEVTRARSNATTSRCSCSATS